MAGIQSILGASTNAVGVISNTIGSVGKLTSAISSADFSSPEGLASAIRSINFPAAGETIGDIVGAISEFTDNTYDNDWRVRLSMAKWTAFKSSPVLKPLVDSGGLIFPYTPSIGIQSGATYNAVKPTHSNYAFQAYQNSDPGSISITAPMYVEDTTQGLYWVAMVHYLRSLTKMFTGNDPKAGNPPPVIFLNGYGQYVFKNVPVVVTKMSVKLDEKADYISVPVLGSAAGDIAGTADALGGLSGAVGGAFGDAFGGAVSTATTAISSIAGGVGQVAGLLGSFGIGGSIDAGTAHVPTKSSFSVTLQPVYSRNSARKFSLDRFVTGGYVNNPFGYI